MTKLSKMNPIEFVETLENEEKRQDSLALIEYLKDTFGCIGKCIKY